MGARLLASDGQGTVIEVPGAELVGASGNVFEDLADDDLMPLPAGSEIFELAGRAPVGLFAGSGEIREAGHPDGRELLAVAAFLPPAYTITRFAAFERREGAPVLPLFAYAPVGWKDGGYVTTAVRVDDDIRQDPDRFDEEAIERGAWDLLAGKGRNRLVRHLVETCALTYGCPAARNYVLGRWEMPVPTSPGCNARCIGCISCQPDGTFQSTQERIGFTPSPAEIVEAAVGHIQHAERPVVSFGQGCEGEPLLAARVIEQAIRGIREATDEGTINLNTNASLPRAVERLFRSGLTSMRVSMNSARPGMYDRYYRPAGYSFGDVLESIRAAKDRGGFVTVNYLVFPGLSDQPSEIEAMSNLVEAHGIDMVQWRNLNIDPDLYWDTLECPDEPGVGIAATMEIFRNRFPKLRHGYFNPYLGERSGHAGA